MNKLSDFEKLDNFINGIGAARTLLQRSYKGEFLIEALILYAALVDGFCRIALILKQQLDSKSQNFNAKYIYQGNDKDFISERTIYKTAFKKSILDKALFDETNALYDFRNKIIHRFIISEVEYTHLGLVLDRYELLFHRLWNIVYGLESEQIARGVGMTIAKETTQEDGHKNQKDIINKIKSGDLEKTKQALGYKLIQDMATFSEEKERERISDDIGEELEEHEERRKIPPGYTSVVEVTNWAKRNGLFDSCVCGHYKMYHLNDKKHKNNDLNSRLKNCNSKGCKCKKYVYKS